ncbi:unnamed protein product [Vitrella brassicaformis CCMP3155]|uniref:Uncharacterized protein n=1 Tax=Vitrella brassicaformis (strain CCMP3155) TaxID=1169540 RepID=A0A0G4EBN8_VITBC|nr:unnamed protein product [Vitrella brassicaformis CCMP3155]|eukprot:CEL92945.1 unnamed protein product [Vitrella brassicaformis CCMP3155]
MASALLLTLAVSLLSAFRIVPANGEVSSAMLRSSQTDSQQHQQRLSRARTLQADEDLGGSDADGGSDGNDDNAGPVFIEDVKVPQEPFCKTESTESASLAEGLSTSTTYAIHDSATGGFCLVTDGIALLSTPNDSFPAITWSCDATTAGATMEVALPPDSPSTNGTLRIRGALKMLSAPVDPQCVGGIILVDFVYTGLDKVTGEDGTVTGYRIAANGTTSGKGEGTATVADIPDGCEGLAEAQGMQGFLGSKADDDGNLLVIAPDLQQREGEASGGQWEAEGGLVVFSQDAYSGQFVRQWDFVVGGACR